ncbi:MAG TPA: UvrD-helicase domain-containing protein [Ktedonobacteraceae bacterium]|nr:UvrD-helicase domain-containing protein [Ktedonobacteraceae bacterium]
MDERIKAEATTAARQLLQRFRAAYLAWTDDYTPLDALVEWYGLHVETFSSDDYPAGTFGYLEDNEDLIWLNRSLMETLRRFTLAHELGHAVLHRASPHSPHAPQQEMPALASDTSCHEPDVQEKITGYYEQEQLQEMLGIGMSYDPRSERELMANLFAAELLMPLERVRTLYLDQQVSAHALAGLFGVSQSAMLNRLVGLTMEPFDTAMVNGTNAGTQLIVPSAAPPTKKHYDQYQQAAIEAPTPALIVAGPGSGKTSTLIGRVDYLLHTLDVEPVHILALTFSRKAAGEMQERLEPLFYEEAMPETQGLRKQQKSQRPTVSTFHAFCAELLRTHGERVGLRTDFSLIDEAEGYFMLRRLANELPLQHYRNLPSPAYYFPDILKAISRAKDELVTPERYYQLAQAMLQEALQTEDEETRVHAEKALEVANIYTLYEAALQQRQDADFGGLIMLAVQLLKDHPEVLQEQQQCYQHILVDEFQDINRASGVLLRLLAGEEQCVWVVGDANQAIYGFRGASPANIANFEQDYPGAVILPLSCNYRSRPDIVKLAESFRYKQLELGAEVDAHEAAETEPVRLTQEDTYVTLAVAPDFAAELAGLVEDIRSRHEQGYAYRDIVILCRTRTLARKITSALVEANLPVIEGGGMLEQEHIKDLLSIVLLIAQSDGMGILRAARQSEHFLSQEDIEALLLAARAQKTTPGWLIYRGEASATMSMEGRFALMRLSTIMQSLSNRATSMWTLLAQYLFIETSLMRNVLRSIEMGETEHKGLLNDYLGMLQLARRYDQQQAALREQEQNAPTVPGAEQLSTSSADTPTLPIIQEQAKGFLDYLRVMLTLRQDGGNRQGVEGDGETSPDVIRVMTVHASKGLEFPVVYLPNLLQQRFPLQSRSNPVPAPEHMLPEGSEGNAAHESGEACLFYVGVTRARDHLILSYSERYGKRKPKRSPYLDPLIAGLADERITRTRWQYEGTLLSDTGDEDEIVSLSQPGEPFIEEMQPQTINSSAIEMYQQCPRKYLYGSIYHFSGEEAAYLLFWQTTQKTMETMQQQIKECQQKGTDIATLPTLEEMREIYTKQWREKNGHTLPFAPIYERHGHEVVALLREKMLANGENNWELRRHFTVEVAGVPIQVAVDRVEDEPQNGTGKPAKFIRTRFGKSKEKPTAGTRELLYARAQRTQYSVQSIELHCHNLSTGETFPITLTTKKEQSLYDALEKNVKELVSHHFPAKPDAYTCPSCPFFLICPA